VGVVGVHDDWGGGGGDNAWKPREKDGRRWGGRGGGEDGRVGGGARMGGEGGE
jgi:hypothetical protein